MGKRTCRRIRGHTSALLLVACASEFLLGPGCRARYAACGTDGDRCDGGASPDSSLGGGSGAQPGSGGYGGGAGAGSAGDTGLGGLVDQPPATVLGARCDELGKLACSGAASRFPLVCENGLWTSAGQCSPTERCATSGDSEGRCREIIPECLNKEPGDWVCRDNIRFRCGSDLLGIEEPAKCDNACYQGDCISCSPDSAEPSSCSNNRVRSCSESGEWVLTACPPESPHCGDGVCVLPPSCAGLAKTCGPGSLNGVGSETCCASPLVDGGSFDIDNDPERRATVSSFRLDRYEVTVGRFRKFKTAWNEGWRPSEGDGKHIHLRNGLGLAHPNLQTGFETGWDEAWTAEVDMSDEVRDGAGNEYATWLPTASAMESRPINFVNYYEATAFCIWDGGFLPSGPEVSFAASGGSEQRIYPWGNDVPGTNTALAVYGCLLSGSTCSGVVEIANVGSTGGVGKFGQLDLAGNLAERTFGHTLAETSCDDCVAYGPLGLLSHSARGGSYESTAEEIGASESIGIGGSERLADVGFRCARPP